MFVTNGLESTATKRLGLDVNGPDSLNRLITVRNRSDSYIDVDLSIEPTDAYAEVIRDWATYDRDTQFTLTPRETKTIALAFAVPLGASLRNYSYAVCLRDANDLGDSKVCRPQVLRVLSLEQARPQSEPTLTVVPQTDSHNPYELKAAGLQDNGSFEVTLTVKNPSRQIERVSVESVDLPSSWYSVEYPGERLAGAAKRSKESLKLASGEAGDIVLKIHPPEFAPAGDYSPMLRVHSRLRPDLQLLRVVYFTIAEDSRLTADLRPEVRSLPSAEPAFEVTVTNVGNVARNLWLEAEDVEGVLNYSFDQPEQAQQTEQAELLLGPGEGSVVNLWPQPGRWWQRLWRLKRREVDFELIVSDIIVSLNEGVQERGLERILLPQRMGKVLYLARRRWLFFLVLVSLLLGGLSALFCFFIVRPSSRPRIVDFSAVEETYQAGEPLRFQWEVTNPEEIERITISLMGEDFETIGDSEYFLQYSSSENLSLTHQSENSDLAGTPQVTENIVCPPANENVQLGIIGRIQDAIGLQPESFICTAVPLLYLSENTSENTPDGSTKTEWLKGSIPDKGKYAFEMKVFRQGENKEIEAETEEAETEEAETEEAETEEAETEEAETVEETQKASDRFVLRDVVIVPSVPASIIEFSSIANEYRVDVQNPTVTNGVLPGPVLLNFTIENSQSLTGIQLSRLNPDGTATNPTYNRQYEKVKIIPPKAEQEDDSQSSVAKEGENTVESDSDSDIATEAETAANLHQFCSESDNRITCENIPIPATEVGEYVFSLVVSSTKERAVRRQTPVVSVRPLAPVIERFFANGTDVREKPHHVLSLNPVLREHQVPLSWEVSDSTTRKNCCLHQGQLQKAKLLIPLVLRRVARSLYYAQPTLLANRPLNQL
ncbi:MAG: hypothetical protein AAFV85_14060 [Cyanobacteria bacterium J06634_6]